MNSLHGLPGRILVALGVSILIAGIVAVYAGPKLDSTYTGSRVVGRGEIVGITIWATSSSGIVRVNVSGASAILYTVVKGDPIGFFTNASAFGVRAEAVDMRREIRGGVFFASARVKLDPLTLIYISKKLSRAPSPSGLSYSLPQGQSLVLVVIPAKYGSPVKYRVHFHVTSYSRLPTGDLVLVGSATALAGVALLAFVRVKTPRAGVAGGGVADAGRDKGSRRIRQD